MMRSLSSAVAGLRTHQTKMDVIGNNIANVNTYGFKASRATFADMFYQNLTNGSGPSGVKGGTNPTQIGYGSSVATIDILNTQSGMSSTDRALDVYIDGDGFLVTQDAMGNYLYTRLGNLGFDASGNLIDSNGNYIMGFPQNEDGTPKINADGTVNGTELQNIRVTPDILDQLTGISISSTGEIIGILPGDAKMVLSSGLPSWIVQGSSEVSSDSNLQGEVHLNVGAIMDATDITSVLGIPVTEVQFGDVGFDANVKLEYKDGKIIFSATRENPDGGTPIPVNAEGYLQNGKIVLKDKSGNIVSTITTTAEAKDLPGTDVVATAIGTTESYQLTTMDKGGNVVTTGVKDMSSAKVDTDGNLILELEDFSVKLKPGGGTPQFPGFASAIGKVGLEEGEKLNVGCIALAKFRNTAGLKQAGGSKYMTTPNSGEATYLKPGVDGTGELISSGLEMSNVDISNEFTQMITTQRGFQANTRIVTVSDEMLQELVNLKR